MRCHDWKGDATDEGDVVAEWLSTFLKQKLRLVKYGGGPNSCIGSAACFAHAGYAIQLSMCLISQRIMRKASH